MEILILSCGTGGGHNSAGFAVGRELEARGHKVSLLNPYTLKSRVLANGVNRAYVSLVQKAPSAFGAVYRIGDLYRRLPARSPVYLVNRRMARILEEYLLERSFDAIVMTHLFPAEMITNLKKRGHKIPKTYFIATDYVCIPFTEETDCDCYIVPSPELIGDFCGRGLPRERIVPLGIPVGAEFSEDRDRARLREELGLDPEKKYILVAGGSVGAGHIDQLVSLLSEKYRESDVRLIVVCGNNRSLYEKLKDRDSENCMILEYTSHMAEYMKACDLFISKPGGLSSTEAAVSGTPLIHIAPIPGCETHNMKFFEKHGMSIAVTSPKDQLSVSCDRLLEGTEKEEMLENQRKNIPACAAAAICDLIENG